MKKWIYRFLIELTNHQFLSKLLKSFTQSKISKPFIKSYAKLYELNQDEMMNELHTYSTLHDLFTRKLKLHAREITQDQNAVTSPVDGVIEDYGTITPSKEIIVKGKSYSIQEMIGDKTKIDKYIGGDFIILYLSPKHYHRIHSPVTGKLIKQYALGTKSYPVNRLGLKYGRSPLAKNYRVVSEVDHNKGSLLIVKVGAMFINSVECTALSDTWVKGEEIAYFSFGSTVVLLFEKNTFSLNKDIQTPKDVKMGELLGYLID
ncbi:phosphatidylserine decarboxylase [Heyndrickxia sporothermodurans]|uniref:Phosphatidylserine decarboxylase proenzyme n=1 Tax=Heyndrickxia sporothermodurans TaxID=46224 RepID=A0AB37HFV0_9BACI|nr:phosphatidylserine decarboxylase [Heyndrickxia sporothermodurans]MBL5768152.1 phosphatidylserine decarboxylase [Heyndrickxia sporothermodurans]MBL5771805.1 phosphatidylserine decarboxylase [Heyndrickxia sporothermodurans]MBL5775434.1 phosphatidylserine decarboxylase [Heyndrickxia sporothermodurans]MBL5779003.1 phosphatidylserine decarboxylase [Heyndrickxia sporothermodurans]MBL5782506.1 phosphatidylserine decarboxylase [Heyndrickxia sporothermodurans]